MEVIDTIVHVKRDSLNEPLQPITLDVNMITLTEEVLKPLCDDCVASTK